MRREIISLMMASLMMSLVMSGCGGSVTADSNGGETQSLESIAQEQEALIAQERSQATPVDLASVNKVQEKLANEGK